MCLGLYFETVRKMYAFEKYRNVFGKEDLVIRNVTLKMCSRYFKHNAFINNFSFSWGKTCFINMQPTCSVNDDIG